MAVIDIAHLCRLARLALDDAEARAVEGDLQRIIRMVDQMQSIDTNDVAPLAHPLEGVQRLRPDLITESVDRDRYQAIAPAVADGLYLVPRVLE